MAKLEALQQGDFEGIFRAMDGLPVVEQTDVPFKSTRTDTYNGQSVGVMHACGHDSHTSILMGIAEALSKVRADLPGNVLFVFQPAEEGAPAGEEGGAELMLKEGLFDKYRPEVAPWQFRFHRLRRLHRKLCHVDRHVAFVGGINLIDDMNTPHQKPPRLDFAVRVSGPLLGPIVQTMQRLWALVELVQFERSEVPLFPEPVGIPRAGTQTAKFVIRDNLRYRRAIERAYLAAIRTAKQEILIALLRRPEGATIAQMVEATGSRRRTVRRKRRW
jgi:hypothetical protein